MKTILALHRLALHCIAWRCKALPRLKFLGDFLPTNQVENAERSAFFGPKIANPDLLATLDQQSIHEVDRQHVRVDAQSELRFPLIEPRTMSHDPTLRRGD